jgi:hypothetical protein
MHPPCQRVKQARNRHEADIKLACWSLLIGLLFNPDDGDILFLNAS